MFGEYSFLTSIFQVIFPLMFLLVLGMIIASLVRGIGRYRKNEASPRLTVDAVVVAKREDVSHTHHNAADNTMFHNSHTTYYATFQVESGDRMELSMDGRAYGMLAENDTGRLTFQGTRYLGFERRMA